MHFALIFALTSLLTSCAAPIVHNTPSGRPEVTIRDVHLTDVSAKLTGQMIDRGYIIKSAQPAVMIFEKPINNLGAAMLFGSRYDSTPFARVTFMLVESEQQTRVVGSLAVITNPGSAFEHQTSFDQSQDSANIQQALNFLKLSMEKPRN
jgi:hypothetical protein